MNTDLIDMVTSSLSPDQIENTASTINLPASRARPLMSGAVAAVLAGLLHRSSTQAGRADLMEALPAFASGTASREGLLERLFGRDKAGPLGDAVSSYAGVSRPAGNTLLAFASMAVMGVLAKLVAQRHLDAGGFGELLAGQRDSIMKYAPPGLASVFGLRNLSELGAKEPNVTIVSAPEAVVQPKRNLRPLIAGLLALGALALGAFALTRHRARAPEEVPTITGATINRPSMPEPKAPEIVAPSMPTMPRVEQEKLPAKLSGKIEFPFASATPTAASMATIDALANDLKQHPSVNVRLDGYTDAIGKDDVNQPLSMQRAHAVKMLLEDRGIDGARITTGAHSEKNPVANNATDPGRAENRRVEATFVER